MREALEAGLTILAVIVLAIGTSWGVVKFVGANASARSAVTRFEMGRLKRRYYELRIKEMERKLGEKP